MSEVPFRSVPPPCCHPNSEPSGDLVIPASLVNSVQEELTGLLTIQVQLSLWFSEYHSYKVPGLEEPSEVPGASDFHAYGVEAKEGATGTFLT